MQGYSRSGFSHWISQGDGCDTRKQVLIRDARDVIVGASCGIISGTWRSFYVGLTLTSQRKVDIDHVVQTARLRRSRHGERNDAAAPRPGA